MKLIHACGESKTYDFAPMLDTPAYSPLKDPDTFKAVYIDYSVPVWCDGDIDISPEYLYQNGIDAWKNFTVYLITVSDAK